MFVEQAKIVHQFHPAGREPVESPGAVEEFDPIGLALGKGEDDHAHQVRQVGHSSGVEDE